MIVRATIRLVPARRSVRRFELFYPDLATMVGDARTLAGAATLRRGPGRDPRAAHGRRPCVPARRGDASSTTPRPDDGVLLEGLSDDPARRTATSGPYLDWLRRLAQLEATLRSNGQWLFPHPWLDHIRRRCARRRRSRGGAGPPRPARRPRPVRPGRALPHPTRARSTPPSCACPRTRSAWAFNLIRIPPTGDSGEARRLVRANRATYRRVSDAGGVLYPVSALPLSPRGWRRHFGPAFATLAKAKRRHDPGRTPHPRLRGLSGLTPRMRNRRHRALMPCPSSERLRPSRIGSMVQIPNPIRARSGITVPRAS